MSAELDLVHEGQTWRRKRDGTITRILFVDRVGRYQRQVTHQAERRTHHTIHSFLDKFELMDSVEGAPVVEQIETENQETTMSDDIGDTLGWLNRTAEGKLTADSEEWDKPTATWHFSRNAECTHDGKLRRVHLGDLGQADANGRLATVKLYGKECPSCRGLLYG